jgi:circadian clock protein KaiC
VVIDSMTALMHNAPAREFREFGVGLSGYFKRRGVAALMTTTLLTLFGGESATGVALSTVADAIVALRYLELEGELRRGIAVVKLRGQAHDRTIQEYEITDDGIRVIGPFHGVAGILAGHASFLGGTHPTPPPGTERASPAGRDGVRGARPGLPATVAAADRGRSCRTRRGDNVSERRT